MKSSTQRKSLVALACTAAGAATALTPAVAYAETSTAVTQTEPDDPITIQGTCGQEFNPMTRNHYGQKTARAHWKVVCRHNDGKHYMYMEGWVDDQRSDGQCAWVTGRRYATDPKTQHAKNCPAGSPRTEFTFKFQVPASDHNVYGYLTQRCIGENC